MKENALLIQELIEKKIKTAEGLAKLKRKAAKGKGRGCASNVELLFQYRQMIKKGEVKPSKVLERLLTKKPIRSLSGIVNVSLLTKPYPCPGACIFCPAEKGLPKSYLGGEPAADRARMLGYDPFLQTKKRIEALGEQGHETEKIELRIVGGTFSFYPRRYQTWFVKRCFDACNGRTASSLDKAQRLNEKARHRIVGLSVETRPDFITKKEILRLRRLGRPWLSLGCRAFLMMCTRFVKQARMRGL